MSGDTDRWATDREHSDNNVYAVIGAIGAAVGGMLSAFVLTLLVGLTIRVLDLSLGLSVQFLLVFLAAAGGIFLAAALYVTFRGFRLFEYVPARLPSTRDLLWIGVGYLGAMGLVFAAGVLLQLLRLNPETTNQAAEMGMQQPELLLWLVPLSFLVIAPAEEVLFRGIVQGRLREAFRPGIAIPLTAALFATVHYFSLTGESGARFIAIAILFLPSLVFGLAYERTRNIFVSIVIHGAYNSTLVLLLYVALRVFEETPMPT